MNTGRVGGPAGRPGWPPAVWRIAPFALFMVWVAGRSAAGETVFGIDARWLYGLQVVSVAALLAWCWRPCAELARERLPKGSELALAVGLGLAVFVAWINLDAHWMTLDGLLGSAAGPSAGFVPVAADGSLRWDFIVVRFIGAALLVPLVEELFWRSWLMRWLEAQNQADGDFRSVDPRRVGLKAIVLSTVVFMLAHTLWLAAIVAGLAYAWIYVRTGNLWTAVVAHAVTNAALGVWVVSQRAWAFW
jgi:uncharacterized protein